jgi:multidrug efflux pump subunit AcrB
MSRLEQNNHTLVEMMISNNKQFFLWLFFLISFGIFSAFKLPLQFMPDAQNKTIDVLTVWPSATPQEVEAEILKPQEEVLLGLPGLKRSNAYAARGTSWLRLEFDANADMEQVLIEVVGRIGRVTALPRSALPPQILRGGENGGLPTLTTFYLQLPAEQKTDDKIDVQGIVDKVIRPAFKQVPGVAQVNVTRGLAAEEELMISFDPYAVARLGIQINDIAEVLQSYTDISGGFIDLNRRRYNMRYVGKVSLPEMDKLVVAWRLDTPVYLKDVAEVSITKPNTADITYLNGHKAIAIEVQRETGFDSLKAIAALKTVATALNKEKLQPLGLSLEHTFDSSTMIRNTLDFLFGNILLGVILAVLPVWWLFRSKSATLLIGVTIPLSIILTMIVLNLSGRSLNVISIAGLALAAGMVLDAALVVQDSIQAEIAAGYDKITAALRGCKAVTGALVVSTITTVCVFMPVVFANESEIQIFTDLAFTIAVSVVISLFLALVLIPVVSSRFGNTVYLDPYTQLWQRLARGIMVMTSTAAKRMMIMVGLIGGGVLYTMLMLPSADYLPVLKQNHVIATFYLPSGTNPVFVEEKIIPMLDQKIQPLLQPDASVPIRNYAISMESSFSMRLIAEPVHAEQTEALEQLLSDDIFAYVPDLSVWVSRPNLQASERSFDTLDLYIQGADMATIATKSEQAMLLIQEKMPDAVVYPAASFSPTELEISVTPDVSKLLQLGFTRADLMQVVQTFGNGVYISEYYDGNRRRNLVLRAKQWQNFDELKSYPVINRDGVSVPFGELVHIEQTFGPAVIQHINFDRTFILTVEPPAGMSLEELHAQLKAVIVPEISAGLPAGYAVNFGGSADSISEVKANMTGYFVFAVILLFLLMAGLFRSIRAAIMVILTLPLATVGGFVLLKILNLFTYQPLDIISMIGFIILLGLVVNNSILLICGVMENERNGLSRVIAVELVIAQRLRPIFLATATTVAGMLPLLVLPVTGSEMYRGLAAALVGGMVFSGVFTLVLLPTLLQVGLFNRRAATSTVPMTVVEVQTK